MEGNKNLLKAFDDIGKDLVKTMVKNLLDANKKATGNLIRSVNYKIVEAANGVMVQLLAEEYLRVVDGGRGKGEKQPPTKALDKWIIARGIAPRDKKGKFLPRESVKFLIARSISRNGIKPTNVIKKTIDEVYSTKQELITTAAIKDIDQMIDKLLFNDNKMSDILKK